MVSWPNDHATILNEDIALMEQKEITPQLLGAEFVIDTSESMRNKIDMSEGKVAVITDMISIQSPKAYSAPAMTVDTSVVSPLLNSPWLCSQA